MLQVISKICFSNFLAEREGCAQSFTLLPPPSGRRTDSPHDVGEGCARFAPPPHGRLIPQFRNLRYNVMAEREGFEPSVPILSEHTISSRAPSASRASLLDFASQNTFNYACNLWLLAKEKSNPT
jgi:hypothetical protein